MRSSHVRADVAGPGPAPRAVIALVLAAVLAGPAFAGAPLPPALQRALARHEPSALADTTLPRLAALDSVSRAAVAESLASWPVPRRVAAWAFLQVGAPYRLGPLGEETPPDTDPLIRYDVSDCAVLNLTSVALAHAGDAGGERAAMAIANYRGGVVSYATRFHFTTDRLDSCAWYADVTRRVGGRLCRSRGVMLNRRADGGRWIAIDWSRPRTVTWIPRASGERFGAWWASGRLPEVVGVAFVRESTLGDGLDVVHESLLWRGHVLLHASSLTGRVVTMPWRDYLRGPGRRHDGFVLFEYR